MALNQNIIPNTTQTPNVIFDEIMPNIKDVQLRVLLVIVRQTMGWIEDVETGRRKEKDWISRSQLILKTGRGKTAVGKAVDMLCNEGVVIAYGKNGEILNSASERKLNFGKIFYRYNQNYGQGMLFKPFVPTKWPRHKVGTQKVATTKETHITKYNNKKYFKKSDREQNLKTLQAIKKSNQVKNF